jgi:Putative Flp pilus-assembly TadE/G-like
VLVALSLVAMLAAASLAIDLGLLYVARSEAQRAADAAALAGASAFVDSGCTSMNGGCVAGGAQETLARQQAETVGAQDAVMGQAASIEDSDVTFNYPTPMEPQISVTVQRTAARGNAIPLLFARFFGVTLGSVSATATAEAFDPSGSNVPVGYGCVAPFLVPNCDPDHTSPVNSSCAGGTAGYFINQSTGMPGNSGLYPAGVMGEPWQLHSYAAPSQWYLVAYNDALGTQISNLSATGNGNGQSASLLRQYISECAPSQLACGQTITTDNGNTVGPTDQGVDARIYASADGPNHGQDTIDTSVGPPFPITGGANNPNPALVGQTYYGPSPSEVLVPVYGGQTLNPGGDTTTIVGFMQIFLQYATHSGNSDLINVVVLKVMGCASDDGSDGNTPSITDTGGAPVPIRLIRTQ